jgi:hypothetical protein
MAQAVEPFECYLVNSVDIPRCLGEETPAMLKTAGIALDLETVNDILYANAVGKREHDIIANLKKDLQKHHLNCL